MATARRCTISDHNNVDASAQFLGKRVVIVDVSNISLQDLIPEAPFMPLYQPRADLIGQYGIIIEEDNGHGDVVIRMESGETVTGDCIWWGLAPNLEKGDEVVHD